jgi:hypothetical protein
MNTEVRDDEFTRHVVIEGYTKCSADDSILRGDDRGYSMACGLMHERVSPAAVRVLINRDVRDHEVVALLVRAIDWITHSPDLVGGKRWERLEASTAGAARKGEF